MTTGLAASMAATLAFGQDSTAKKTATPAKPAAAAPKPAAAQVKPPAAAVKPATPAKPVLTAKPATGTPASATNPVVVTIGAETITKADFETFLAALPEQVRTQMPKRRIAEQIADIKIFAAEARKRSLDRSPMTQIEMDQALATALFRDIQAKTTITSADVAAYYEKNKSQYEKVKARHILLRFKGSPVPVRDGQKDLTKEEAKAKAEDLKKQIDGGADFAALAKKESDDAGWEPTAVTSALLAAARWCLPLKRPPSLWLSAKPVIPSSRSLAITSSRFRKSWARISRAPRPRSSRS